MFCCECVLVLDRDLNAAVNLGAWGDDHPPPDLEARGRIINACGQASSGEPIRDRETGLDEAGTLWPTGRGTPEKGGAGPLSRRMFDTL